jgi:hypothetical protein
LGASGNSSGGRCHAWSHSRLMKAGAHVES